MVVFKIAPVFLLALVAAADKKIELQDIEEDNLKSEREKDHDPSQAGPGSGPGLQSLDFLKSGLFQYFQNPTQSPQPTRYVHQYSVTEQPEPQPVGVQNKAHFTPSGPAPQQAMVGYLSNVPMQIFLVPQYYSEESETSTNQIGHVASGAQYTHAPASAGGRVPGYPTAPESQAHGNYIEVPAYVGPTGKTYVQQYPQPVASHQVAYIGYTAQPTAAPVVQPTVAAPVVTYQVPVVQYQTAAVVTPQSPPRAYYQSPQHYTETNAVEEVHETGEENPKHYPHSEVSYVKSPASEYPRFYTPRPPAREEFRHSQIQELPHPSPLLLKAQPAHLSHIPKALPVHRPLNKPVYGPSNHIPGPLIRHSEPFGVPPFKRRPTSLLDSYVPSSLQVEYMKRGYTNDPLVAYEALSSGRHFSHSSPHSPRHFERGFLPNQMYHTAAGGVTFGHYKRGAPKVDKSSQNK